MAAMAVAPRASSPTLDSRRTSMLSSSASSFQTANSAPRSASTARSFSSSSSSVHTLSAQSPPTADLVNPIHTLAHQSQEVHIVKVTNDKVQLEVGPPSESLFNKVGRHFTSGRSHVPQIITDSHEPSAKVGPPPPSPPASEEHFMQDEASSKAEAQRPSTDLPPRERKPSAGSVVSFDPSVRQPRAGPSQPLHRASTDTKASFSTGRTGASTIVPRIPLSSSPDTPTADHMEASTSQAPSSKPARSLTSTMSSDGYLQPPVTTPRQPKRRNTIGAATSPISPILPFDDINADGELASEIQQQQEQIMRERLSKRAKAQQEAEAALTRSKSRTDERPLIGNWVKEGHENYVMMYNMLTGIRIAVRNMLFTYLNQRAHRDFLSGFTMSSKTE